MRPFTNPKGSFFVVPYELALIYYVSYQSSQEIGIAPDWQKIALYSSPFFIA